MQIGTLPPIEAHLQFSSKRLDSQQVSATLVPIIEYEEKLLKDGVTEKKL
jgi:hypothetical protein